MGNIIKGKLYDTDTKAPIPGITVSVTVNGTGQTVAGLTAVTKQDGTFEIENSPYMDGDNSVFLASTDPTGRYLPGTYAYADLQNVDWDLYPDTLNKTKIPAIVVVLVLLGLVAAGYFFLIKKR